LSEGRRRNVLDVVDVVDDEGVVVVMLIGLGAGLVGGCIMGNFG
jgi:hypothetical protein